jgi:DNA ligase (NAD+)
MRELAKEMTFVVEEKMYVANSVLTGKNICVTGKLNNFTRDSINAAIESAGAKAVGSVSKTTDYLVTNEASGSSKYKKAVQLGIAIINEEEFMEMLN